MKELIEFLNDYPVQYLATIGLDGKPKCRPFMYAAHYDGKIWFCTGSGKDVSRELKANPHLELSVAGKEFTWARVSGQAIFSDNIEVKEICLQIPIVKSIYKTSDNPVLEVFYIANGSAIVTNLSGTPPHTFKL